MGDKSLDYVKMEVCDEFFLPCTTRGGTPEDHRALSFATFEAEEQHAETIEFPPLKNDQTLRQYYMQYIDKSTSECMREGFYAQRSKEWKLARQFCLTASDFGAAIGTNPYESQESLVHKKIHIPFQGNKATAWGSAMEPRAAEAFLTFAKHSISKTGKAILHHPNLVKFSAIPWLAVSPDGILEYEDDSGIHYDLVEFKCPTQAPKGVHPYKRYEQCIPPYYMTQMIGIKGYCNINGGIPLKKNDEWTLVPIQKIWFVVWQPSDLWVTEVQETVLFTDVFLKLRKWYFELFLPRLYEKLRQDDSRCE